MTLVHTLHGTATCITLYTLWHKEHRAQARLYTSMISSAGPFACHRHQPHTCFCFLPRGVCALLAVEYCSVEHAAEDADVHARACSILASIHALQGVDPDPQRLHALTQHVLRAAQASQVRVWECTCAMGRGVGPGRATLLQPVPQVYRQGRWLHCQCKWDSCKYTLYPQVELDSERLMFLSKAPSWSPAPIMDHVLLDNRMCVCRGSLMCPPTL